MYSLRQRAFAAGCGIACHLAFTAAVGMMMWKLYRGLHGGPDFPLPLALGWNLLLILQFPLFHSLLLTPAGGRILSLITLGSIGTELRSTTFALIASLQLLLSFLFWAPLGPVWIEFQGFAKGISTVVYASSWGLLLKSMSDAGLGVQMGYLGWWAVFRNRKPLYKPFEERGTLRMSRHPMYLAYTMILWTGPVWSIDHIILAGCWSSYCVLAPLHKEYRYRKRYGAPFLEYQKRVPYFLPRLITSHKSKTP